MNTIKVITELSAEDRKLIEALLGGIGLLTSVIGNALPQETQEAIIAEATDAPQVAETNSLADENPATAPIIEDPTPVAEPTPEVKPVSLAEFQKAVTLAVSKSAEAKQTVKAIINQYASSVSAVPEDKRAEVMAELEKI